MTELTGTLELLRLILRRDRRALLVWLALILLVVVGIAASIPRAYPTDEARQAFADESNADPTQQIMLGPVYDASIGGLAAWRVRGQIPLIMGLAALLLVVRHTRTEEEKGRRELLGSTVVGRYAPLTAALIETCAASLVIGLVVALGLMGVGLPAVGSLSLGLSATASGWIMAAIAAVGAQVAGSAGGARGLAGAALALFYLTRGIADVGQLEWLSWLSPLGWIQQMRPFAGDFWGPLGLTVAVSVGLAGVAYALSARRDLGAGLLPPRLGPANAAPGLRSPLALAWRLQGDSIIGWAVGFGLLGAAIGGVGSGSLQSIFANEQLKGVIAPFGGDTHPTDGLFALMIYVLGQLIAMYSIHMVLWLRSEETALRADPVLAAPVSRRRWAFSGLAVAAIGPVVILGALGLGLGLTYGLATGDLGRELPRMMLATLVRVPSCWLIGGIAAALYGLLPRLAGAVTWIILAVFLALEYGAEFHFFSPAILSISPFAASPGLPAAEFTATPLLVLVAVAAALVAAGLAGFERRDVA